MTRGSLDGRRRGFSAGSVTKRCAMDPLLSETECALAPLAPVAAGETGFGWETAVTSLAVVMIALSSVRLPA